VDRTEKEAMVQNLAERLARAKAVVLTDFTGLKVEQITQLRQQLRDKGHEYVVVKNRLMKRAILGREAAVLAESLVGPNGLGFGYGEPVDLAKILVEFAKNNPQLKVKGGLLEGKSLSSDQVGALAKLPAKEVLLSLLLGAMNAVPQNLVMVLAAVMRSLLLVLTALAEKRAAEPASS
jgi:large subunit ribosomal protein L10